MGEDEKVHTFFKGINPKMNVIELLEFKLADYNVTVPLKREGIRFHKDKTGMNVSLMTSQKLQ